MAKCNCPKKKSSCNCKGKKMKIETGARTRNGRYELDQKSKKELNTKVKSKRKSLYADRVKKGQMTKAQASRLEKRDKKLKFY